MENDTIVSKKKKKRSDVNSPRYGPEGDSINKKEIPKIKKTKSPKIMRGISSDSENISPAGLSPKKKKRKSQSSDIQPMEISPGKKSKTENGLEGKVAGKGKKKSNTSLNASWEKAVEKARGLPDGATEGNEDSFFSYSDPNSPDKKKKENGEEDKKSKKKTMNVLQTAAKKLKKIGGKSDADSAQGTKRKRTKSGDETDSKTDDMTKKERKKQRRMFKNNYEVAGQAKVLWNKLRQQNLTEEDRHRLSGELLVLVQGKAKELIFAHDTSRVIQCLMKYGTQEHKTAVFEELREHILKMMTSKYAKFFVRKLLKYGTKSQRHYVFRKMYGNVRKLMKHQEAAELVELAYNDYANQVQRAALVEEFYGPSFSIFKTEEARTLDQIMKSNPEKRDSILRNLKEALTSLVDKSICTHSIVHRVFLEYFTYANDKQKSEMIEIVREHVVHMLHTRDGARIAMHCLWYGTAKDRKVIMKTFKTYITKICKEEYGHMVLLVTFDVVDDTTLIQKIIIEEMMKSFGDIVLDKYGRKVIIYLLSHRDPGHFCPDIVRVLQQGDGNANSKKDMAIRRQELLTSISEPIVKTLKSTTKQLVMHNGALLVIMAVITKANCDVSPVVAEVAKIAAEPYVVGGLENFHIVEHPAGHIMLKKLIANDKRRMSEGKDLLFSNVLINTVPAKGLKSWAAGNRGCFTLVNLLELNHPSITLQVKKVLLDVKGSLQKMDFQGAKTLLQKLNL